MRDLKIVAKASSTDYEGFLLVEFEIETELNVNGEKVKIVDDLIDGKTYIYLNNILVCRV